MQGVKMHKIGITLPSDLYIDNKSSLNEDEI